MSLWVADGCDLKIVFREDLSPFFYEVSIRKRELFGNHREIEKQSVGICAFARFHKQLELLLIFLCCACANEPCGEIARHLMNLKLDAHYSPLSHTMPRIPQNQLYHRQPARCFRPCAGMTLHY